LYTANKRVKAKPKLRQVGKFGFFDQMGNSEEGNTVIGIASARG
jgi:hypothetical protein